MSWDDDFLGARASRPHKPGRSFAYLPHFDQPGTAPLLPFRLADAVPADRVGCLQDRTEDLRPPSGTRCWLPPASMTPRHWCGRTPWQEQDAGGTPALPGDTGSLPL